VAWCRCGLQPGRGAPLFAASGLAADNLFGSNAVNMVIFVGMDSPTVHPPLPRWIRPMR